MGRAARLNGRLPAHLSIVAWPIAVAAVALTSAWRELTEPTSFGWDAIACAWAVVAVAVAAVTPFRVRPVLLLHLVVATTAACMTRAYWVGATTGWWNAYSVYRIVVNLFIVTTTVILAAITIASQDHARRGRNDA